MRKIIYTRPDGGMSVVHPVINTHPQREQITEAEAEQRAWNKLPKDAINPRWADASEIPQDRTFRNAWEDNGRVNVNMPKAREIHKSRLRELRKPKLEALDVEYMRALERAAPSSEMDAIATKKQALRDVTIYPLIDSAATPADLEAAIPEILK